MGGKWKRVCNGLYVSPTGKWVINHEGPGWYSVRELIGWGPLLDGVTMFPDSGDIWYGDYKTLAEAKASVARKEVA